MGILTTLQELEAIYGSPGEASIVKEVDAIIPHYRRLIEASPFAILATAGPEGLDCSPRGDLPGFVRVHDEKTLLLPDRRGNNRVGSLRNIIRDARVALLFLIPGSGTTLRVNGRAQLTTDAPLLQSFAIEKQLPRTVMHAIVFAANLNSSVRTITETELLNAVRREQPVQFVFRQEPKRSAALANLVGGEYRCFSQGQNRVVAIQVKVKEAGEERVAGAHCIDDRSNLHGRDLADLAAADA